MSRGAGGRPKWRAVGASAAAAGTRKQAAAHAPGVVRRGDTLLDSSSGIYAYALAPACHRYGMRCHIVGSTTVDHTLRTQLAVLGATLEQMEPCSDLKLDRKRRVKRVHEILAEHPGHHWMRQYHDDVHYLGYRAVADLIRGATDGAIRPLGHSGTRSWWHFEYGRRRTARRGEGNAAARHTTAVRRSRTAPGAAVGSRWPEVRRRRGGAAMSWWAAPQCGGSRRGHPHRIAHEEW